MLYCSNFTCTSALLLLSYFYFFISYNSFTKSSKELPQEFHEMPTLSNGELNIIDLNRIQIVERFISKEPGNLSM